MTTKTWVITGESNDWCGISENFILTTTNTDDTEEDILNYALGLYGGSMDDLLWEYYTQDEEEEDYIADPSYSYSAVEYSEEVHGNIDCGSYHKLN